MHKAQGSIPGTTYAVDVIGQHSAMIDLRMALTGSPVLECQPREERAFSALFIAAFPGPSPLPHIYVVDAQ